MMRAAVGLQGRGGMSVSPVPPRARRWRRVATLIAGVEKQGDAVSERLLAPDIRVVDLAVGVAVSVTGTTAEQVAHEDVPQALLGQEAIERFLAEVRLVPGVGDRPHVDDVADPRLPQLLDERRRGSAAVADREDVANRTRIHDGPLVGCGRGPTFAAQCQVVLASSFTMCLAAVLTATSGVQYFGDPTPVEVAERGATQQYVVLTKKAPVRAEITGPGVLQIDLRAPFGRAQKKSKNASLKLLVDTMESGRFSVDVRSLPRANKARFQGRGMPRGKVPSASQIITVPVEAGSYFFELQLEGAEPMLLIALQVLDASAAPPTDSEPTPDESMVDLPALPGLPGLPGEADSFQPPPPLPTDTVEATPELPTPGSPPTEDAPSRVAYGGSTIEATIEELGDSRVYRELTGDKPLRAEITGPGRLMVSIRGALSGTTPMAAVVHLDIDGTEQGAFPVTLEHTPPSAGTRFVSGGAPGKEPSAEAWFTLDVGPGTAFCSLTLEPPEVTAYIALEITPTSSDAAAGIATAKSGGTALLSREALEQLQRDSTSSGETMQEVGRPWRFAIEAAGGPYSPLVEGARGYGARVGVQLTAPWVGGLMGLSLSAGAQQATSSSVAIAGDPHAPQYVELDRQRRLVPVEGGMHVMLRPARLLRVALEGGAGYYWLEMTRTALGRTRTAYRANAGGWGAIRVGAKVASGMVFLAGRYYSAGAVTTARGTVSLVGVGSELGYAVEF